MKLREAGATLLFVLAIILSGCGTDTTPVSPPLSAAPIEQSKASGTALLGSTNPANFSPTAAPTISQISSPSSRAGTASSERVTTVSGKAPANPTPPAPAVSTISNASPNGNLAVVQDGHLLLVKSDGSIREVTLLGADLSAKLSVRWSPDGSQFLMNEVGRKLTLIGLDGKRTPLIEVDPAKETIGTLSWARSGKYLAFERFPSGERGRELHSEIWLSDLSRPNSPAVNIIANGFAPAFSPDGRNLAYLSWGRDISSAGKVLNNAINLTSPDGKQSRHVLDVEQLPEYHNPDGGLVTDLKPALLVGLSWSPDGRYLTFHDENTFVGTVAATGGRARILWYNTAKESGQFSRLAWSSRSDQLTFSLSSKVTQNSSHGWVVDNSGKVAQFTDENLTCLNWSPDGGFLAMSSGSLLKVVRAADQQVYGSIKTPSCAVWSPEGGWLVLSQENSPEPGKGLQIVRPDGSELHQLAALTASRQLTVLGWKK